MTAFKCDRCGKLFAVRPSGKEHSFDRPEDSTVQRIGWGTEVYLTPPKDLCDECSASFVLWWKEPALAAITNEEKL